MARFRDAGFHAKGFTRLTPYGRNSEWSAGLHQSLPGCDQGIGRNEKFDVVFSSLFSSADECCLSPDLSRNKVDWLDIFHLDTKGGVNGCKGLGSAD